VVFLQANYQTIAVKNVNQVKGIVKKHRQSVGSVDYFLNTHTSHSPARPRLSDEKGANIIFGSKKENPNCIFLFTYTGSQPVSHLCTDYKSALPNLYSPFEGGRGMYDNKVPTYVGMTVGATFGRPNPGGVT